MDENELAKNITKIKYKGYSIGLSITIADPEINIFKKYEDAFAMCLLSEQTMKNIPECQEFFKTFLSNLSDINEIAANSYEEGLKNGIKYGLKLKGLQVDNAHLDFATKSKNAQFVYKYIFNFFKKKREAPIPNNNLPMTTYSNIELILANVGILVNVKKVRENNYANTIVNNFINSLIENPEFKNLVENTWLTNFSDYLIDYRIINQGNFTINQNKPNNNTNLDVIQRNF